MSVWTDTDWRYGFTCVYCKRHLLKDQWHWHLKASEHLVPVKAIEKRFGPEVAKNERDNPNPLNLVTSCYVCNTLKGDGCDPSESGAVAKDEMEKERFIAKASEYIRREMARREPDYRDDLKKFNRPRGGGCILSDYVDAALREATYDKLEDGTYAGRIPSCPGVVAFGASLRTCEQELRSTLED